MDFSDWVTVVVSLIVGLGSAGITNFVNTKKAKQDRADAIAKEQRDAGIERTRVLRNYQRVLEDVLGDFEDETVYQQDGPITVRYETYIQDARAEAFHYFHLFSEEEQRSLRWPIDVPEPTHSGPPPQHNGARKAVETIKNYLAPVPE
ncbi:hypothetical protein [Arthrobacter sp. TMN-50]